VGVSDRQPGSVQVVEVFAEVVCPFAHVGLRRFVARRSELGTATPLLRVRAWPLELINGQPFDPEKVAHDVAELRRQVVPELFARFTPAAVPHSSLSAFALVADAQAQSDQLGEEVALAVRTALFEDGLNVGDADVLAEIARTHGLERPHGDVGSVCEVDHAEGLRRGVQGSPHFFVGDHGYFCPSLRIDRRGDAISITFDPARLDALLDDCFGPSVDRRRAAESTSGSMP
jgi:predicted DsbA family dithiol-disulfide isomerase